MSRLTPRYVGWILSVSFLPYHTRKKVCISDMRILIIYDVDELLEEHIE